MRDVILLDNQSTTTLFCNPSLVQDIKPSKETMYLSTNGGILATDSVAEVPEWGQVWYNPSAITNIFGFSDMVSKHRVTYDSEAEDAFIVHLPDKLVKFSKTSEGLYIGEEDRKAQDTYMLYRCLMASLSSYAKKRITIWSADQYQIGNNKMYSGVALLKIIMRR